MNHCLSECGTITSLSFSTSPWYNQPGVMLMQLNFEGIAVGAASLLIIGAFHPLVIWCEYHFTQRVWPVFLVAGLLCLCGALFVQGIISIVLGLLGVACIWSIRELKEQARRVEKGWFPRNPRRRN